MNHPLGIFVGATSAPVLFGAIGVGWLLSAILMGWRRLAGVVAASTMGLAASIYLGIQHHPSSGSSICTVSSVIDCDLVNRSSYSELAGIPIAFLGSAFYAGALVLALVAMRNRDAYPRAGNLLFGGGVLAVGYSVFLAFASYKLGAVCPFCISLYGVNLLILIGGALEARSWDGGGLLGGITDGLMGKDDGSLKPLLGAGVVTFVVAMGGYGQLGEEEKAPVDTNDPKALIGLYEATRGEMVLDGTEPIFGAPSAPYTLVEFADFQCPSCARVAPEIHDLVMNNPDVRVLFKHYPISGFCNDLIEGPAHANACGAAAAGECARQQGRFWELNRLMFKNQDYLDRDGLDFMVGQIQIDATEFSRCMDDPSTMKAVRQDIAHANTVGVQGTPSLFLLGLEGDQWVQVHHTPEDVATLISAKESGTELPPIPPAGSTHGH